MIQQVPTPLTHPQTALWVVAVPVFLTFVVILAIAVFGRRTLIPACQLCIVRYASRKHGHHMVNPALVFVPPIISPARFLAYTIGTLLVLWLTLWWIAPMFVALLLAPVATIGLMWLLLWTSEQRYVNQLNKALPATVGRLTALLANNGGFQPVITRMVQELPEGPLKVEWSFIITHLGMPLSTGGPANAQTVVAALRQQTPSLRHKELLGHMTIALGQTHDILTLRMQAATTALYDAEQRQSEATTALAHMKYSGMAIGLAGMALMVFLVIQQWERVAAAYSSPVGILAGILVGAGLLTPTIGGILLSRVEDVDY
jgi:Flp pilus assembly protein TadB